MPLDALYGAGVEQEWLTAVDRVAADVGLAAAVQLVDIPFNGVRAYVAFTKDDDPVGTMKVDFYAHAVHFPALMLESAYRQRGVYTRVLKHVLDFIEAQGITEITAVSGSEESGWVLRLGGFVYVGPDRLRAKIGRRSRRKQYVAWKEGRRGEPQWHAQLKANPPPELM